jgi:hypothetical protein
MSLLRKAALAAALCFSSTLAWAENGFILNALDSTQTIFVVDNGKQVCVLNPGEGCSWNMVAGSHHVEILNEKGSSIFRNFDVPGSVPGLVVEDSAFRLRQPLALEDIGAGAAIP